MAVETAREKGRGGERWKERDGEKERNLAWFSGDLPFPSTVICIYKRTFARQRGVETIETRRRIRKRYTRRRRSQRNSLPWSRRRKGSQDEERDEKSGGDREAKREMRGLHT